MEKKLLKVDKFVLHAKGVWMEMIKFTNLSKALKGCNYTAWIKKNNHNFIVTDYFIIKTNKEIEGSALTKLVKILREIPQENQGLQARYEHRKEMTDDEIANWLKLLKPKNTETINFTNLIYQTRKDLFSVFKSKGGYIFINKLYIDLVDVFYKNIEIYGNTSVSPIYFINENEEIMVLPCRIEEDPFYLKGV